VGADVRAGLERLGLAAPRARQDPPLLPWRPRPLAHLGDVQLTAQETHNRFFTLINRHGTDEEKQAAAETMRTLMMFKQEEPTLTLEPMDEVILPGFLANRCVRIATERQGRARRFSLDNKHGAIRTYEEELRSVEAQHAACLMLGLEFGAAATHQAAKAHGNLGSNMSAHCPRPGSFGLIVGEKEPPIRSFFLIYEEGTLRYRCAGWVRAGLVQTPEYQRTFHRGNVVSRPYMVPSEQLSPLRTWFT
jgi:hypothetical protein